MFLSIHDNAQIQIMEERGIADPSEVTDAQRDMVEARYNEINPIKIYLNFDMIGSPNSIYGVMDGDLSDTNNTYPWDFEPPKGTSDIESLFNEFFADNDEATVPQALSKRSDSSGFTDWGAFGGLFTGAERVKSAEEAEQFGGEVDVTYDKRYHQACDDLNNVSNEALTKNLRALAYVATYVKTREPSGSRFSGFLPGIESVTPPVLSLALSNAFDCLRRQNLYSHFVARSRSRSDLRTAWYSTGRRCRVRLRHREC